MKENTIFADKETSIDMTVEDFKTIIPEKVFIYDIGDQITVGFGFIKKIGNSYSFYLSSDNSKPIIVSVSEKDVNAFIDKEFKRILCYDLEDRIFYIENNGKTTEQLLEGLIPTIHSSQSFISKEDFARVVTRLDSLLGLKIVGIESLSDNINLFSGKIDGVLKKTS